MLGVWQLGTLVVFSMFAGVLLVIAANVWLLGKEPRGRALEEIAGQAPSETCVPMRR
jgi:hypothetical protein